MKKLVLIIVISLLVVSSVFSATIQSLDNVFYTYLLNNYYINTDADKSQISVEEARAFTGTINISNQKVKNLLSLQYFVNLTAFVYDYGIMSKIDISKNTKLKIFSCSNSNLTNIDISNNINLEFLYCSYNKLTNIDISNNINLKTFKCKNNKLTNIDISNNINLEFLDCSYNLLSILDVSSNINLKYLITSYNPSLTCIGALTSQIKSNWTNNNLNILYSESCANITTSISDDINIQTKSINNYYNIHGQIITDIDNYQGLYIVQYIDGTITKLFK